MFYSASVLFLLCQACTVSLSLGQAVAFSSSNEQGQIAFASGANGFKAASSSAEDDHHASSLIGLFPQPGVSSSSLPNSSTFNQQLTMPTIARPVNTPMPSPQKILVKRKVKVRRTSAANAEEIPGMCWEVKKRCCFVEVNAGYQCRDYYPHKYARCHPVIKYEEECGEEKHEPKDHPNPGEKTKWEETVLKNYDANYGPHVHGYPATGESKMYFSEDIPERPHGVSASPYPAPMPVTSGANYPTEGTGSNSKEEYKPYTKEQAVPKIEVGNDQGMNTHPTETKEYVKPTSSAMTSGSGNEQISTMGTHTPTTTVPRYTAPNPIPTENSMSGDTMASVSYR